MAGSKIMNVTNAKLMEVTVKDAFHAIGCNYDKIVNIQDICFEFCLEVFFSQLTLNTLNY